MRTVAIINQKGGCGKTTTAINLAAVLARSGRRTLLVDMDPQSHCAAGLGIPDHRLETDIGDAMLAHGKKPVDTAKLLWHAGRNLDLAPSRMKLAGLEASRGGLAELPDRDRRLAGVLHSFRDTYDIACIDCPPSIGLLTYNALAAASMVVIPVETSFFSLQGATRQVNTVRAVARRLGITLPVWLLATIHDQTNAVATDLLEELHRRFKDRVIPVVIRRDAKLREASSFGQSIFDYAPRSAGAEDYARLAEWILANAANAPTVADLEPVIEEAAPVAVADDEEDILGEEWSDAEPTDAPAPPVQAASAAQATLTLPAEPELKPSVSRAEDVARRAQEFLRKVALGRAIEQAAQNTPADPSEIGGPTRLAARQVLAITEETAPAPHPSARRLFGVRATNQGILFVQPLHSGHRISIAGTFNNWNPETHVMRRNTDLGVYELCVKLPPGRFLYRLVIDGQWTADPYNNSCEPNPFGDTNSVLEVGLANVG